MRTNRPRSRTKYKPCGGKLKCRNDRQTIWSSLSRYTELDELTPYALRELIKAIYIEAPDKSSGKRQQGIRIAYDLIGFIPLAELEKEETA